MAKFIRTPKFNAEDYAEGGELAPPWFQKFLTPVNTLVDTLDTVFKRLTVTDNMSGGYFELDLVTTGAVAVAFPKRVKSQYGRAREVQIVQALDTTVGRTPIALSGCPAWDNVAEGYIQINDISGLSANKKYKIVFRYLTE